MLIIGLYMQLAAYFIIDSFHISIEKLDWSFFIKNIKRNYLGVTRIYLI